MRFVLALVALLVPLAGCLSDDPADDPTLPPATLTDSSWAAAAVVNDEGGHDHRNWEHHVGMSTPNFETLAHEPLGIPGYGNVTAGGHFCGGATTTGEGRRISVVNSFDTNVAFSVIDATDPMHPMHLGDFYLDFAQTYDVDVTPDGRHVVIAANVPLGGQQSPPPGAVSVDAPVTLTPSFRDACTGELRQGPEQTVAVGPSTILVSIEDPSDPVFRAWIPEPVIGPHSVSTAQIDGTTYAVSSITNLVHHASYFHFYEVLDTPAGGTLVHLSLVDAGTVGDMTALTNGHMDAEIAKHPVTGQTLVYISNWSGGLAVLDFSIPQLPLMIGAWEDDLPQGGAIHGTFSLADERNGRHYVLAGQEFIGHPVNRPSGWIYILDDTDPTNVFEVGRWTLPVEGQLDWGGVELFSTHYFRVVNDTVFVAMYHGGVWAFHFDFDAPENTPLPPSVGVFMPDQPGQDGRVPSGFYDYSPFVLDVFAFEDNTLLVYDNLSGVYSVRFDPENPMPAPEAWPREGRAI